MAADDLEGFSFDDVFPRWFWGVGIVLVVGVSALLVIWYVEHPDRSPWTDFARARFAVPDDLSGLDDAAPAPGDPAPPG